MKIRLNNIRNEFDKYYSITKFAFLPVICESDKQHIKAKYIVWLSDYVVFFDIKTNKIIGKQIY